MNSAWHKNCCNLFSFLVVCACCISSFVNCNEEVCVDLPDIPHATLSTGGKEPPFLPGVKIPVRCKPGYTSGGFALQIECILSEKNVAWSLPIQSCNARSCGFPGDIENAERTGNVFTFPNTVTYACKEGYKLKDRATLYCLPTGSWNPSLPSCEAIICPLLPHPQNGRVVSLDRHYNATANYECEKGFRVEGPSQRTCGLDSQWSGKSPVCTVVTCLPLGELENIRIINEKETYSFDDFVIFTCLYNKVSLASRCLESGHWSKRPPSCPGYLGIFKQEPTAFVTRGVESYGDGLDVSHPTFSEVETVSPTFGRRRSCGFPGDVENAQRIGDIFYFPNTVTYTCNKGYKLKGWAKLYCRRSGSWNPSLPSCIVDATKTDTILLTDVIPNITEGATNSSEHHEGDMPIHTHAVAGVLVVLAGCGVVFILL